MKTKNAIRFGLTAALLLGWAAVLQNCDIVISSSVSRLVFSSTMNDPGYRSYNILIASEDGTNWKGLCATELVNEIYPSVSRDGTKIAFSSQRELDDVEIGVVNSDGTGLKLLTDNTTDDTEPQISPDGNKVLYTNGSNICVVDTSGTGSSVVLVNGFSPAWSPNGGKIVYVSGNDIYYMNSNGSDFPGLNVSDPSMAYIDSAPAFSPDGRKIAFVSSRPNENGQNDAEIYSVNVDGTNLVQITHNADTDDLPLWSPNGRKIAFMGNSAGLTAICSVIADGQSPIQQLTPFTNSLNSKYRWSPDSRQLIFQSERDGNLEIYIMNADGTNQRPVRSFPASDEIDPAWCFE